VGFKVVDQKIGRMACGLLKGKEWRVRELKKKRKKKNKKGKNMWERERGRERERKRNRKRGQVRKVRMRINTERMRLSGHLSKRDGACLGSLGRKEQESMKGKIPQ
jgi:hypothetical protein